jgi:hypothetical protein
VELLERHGLLGREQAQHYVLVCNTGRRDCCGPSGKQVRPVRNFISIEDAKHHAATKYATCGVSTPAMLSQRLGRLWPGEFEINSQAVY